MVNEYSRRDLLKQGGLALAGIIGGTSLLAGCDSGGKLLFDDIIEGERVIYYAGGGLFTPMTRIEIYENDKLSKIIIDYGGEEIGDVNWDKYIVIVGENKKITYTRTYVTDENGRTFQGSDEVSRKALEIGKKRLAEANELYSNYKEKIIKKLESRL